MQDNYYMHEITADIKLDMRKMEHRNKGMQFLGLYIQKPYP